MLNFKALLFISRSAHKLLFAIQPPCDSVQQQAKGAVTQCGKALPDLLFVNTATERE